MDYLLQEILSKTGCLAAVVASGNLDTACEQEAGVSFDYLSYEGFSQHMKRGKSERTNLLIPNLVPR